MLQPHQRRTYQVRQKDGTWIAAEMGSLEEQDVIRVFEPDGTPVVRDGEDVFVVTDRPSVLVETQDIGTRV